MCCRAFHLCVAEVIDKCIALWLWVGGHRHDSLPFPDVAEQASWLESAVHEKSGKRQAVSLGGHLGNAMGEESRKYQNHADHDPLWTARA